MAFSDTDRDYAIERFYNSYSASTRGSIGNGWNLSFGQGIRLLVQDGGATVQYNGPSGSREVFTRDGSGNYSPPYGSVESLTRDGSGWTVSNDDEATVSHFDADGYEISRDIDGHEGAITTSYEPASHRATAITDDVGRTVTLTYNSMGLVSALTGPDGVTTTYAYRDNGDLYDVRSGGNYAFYYDQTVDGVIDRILTGPGVEASISTLPSRPSNPPLVRHVTVTDADLYAVPGTPQRRGPLITYSKPVEGGGLSSPTNRTYSDWVTHSPEGGPSVYRFEAGSPFAIESEAARTTLPNGTPTPATVRLSGSLYDNRTQALTDDEYTLHWTAAQAPPGAGPGHHLLADVKILVNGEQATDDFSDCPSGCATAAGDWTFDAGAMDPGQYVIRVVSTTTQGATSSQALRVVVPARQDPGDPELDAPEIDPATLPDIDGAPCEVEHGVGSDYCSEPADSAGFADASSTPLPPKLGPALAGPAAALANPAMAPEATSGSSAVEAPRSSSTKTLGYGIAQGDVNGNVDGPVSDVSYFGDPNAADPALKESLLDDLHVKKLRVVVPYNLMDSSRPGANASAHKRFANFEAIYANAVRTHTELMVSFHFRCGAQDPPSCYDGSVAVANQKHKPSQSEYITAISDFKNRFPMVRYMSAWNEPNLKNRSPVSTKHAGIISGPQRSAFYTYLLVHSVCPKVKAKLGRKIPCDVVAGEFAGDPHTWFNYMRRYSAELSRRLARANQKSKMPTIWAFHPYSDVEGKSPAPARSELAKYARMVPTGSRVWMSEVGSMNHRVHKGPSESEAAFEVRLKTHQSSEVRYLFDELATYRRSFTRVYYFALCFGGQGPGADGKPRASFEPALLGPFSASAPAGRCVDGAKRPAYEAFKSRSTAAD